MWSSFGINVDHISTKLRSNLGTPSVEVWSKFALDINETHSKVKVFDQLSTKLWHQTSTPPVSKFARNFDQTSTRHLGVEVWPNCGYVLVKIVDICWSELWIYFDQDCGYCLVKVMDMCCSELCMLFDQNCAYYLIKIANICLSKLWILFWTILYWSIWLLLRILTAGQNYD